MWLIAGLGNPDRKYMKTRHNAGFMAIDELARLLGAQWSAGPKKTESMMAQAEVNGQKALLLKPLTYMNLSGTAVREVLKKYNIALENLIVIQDDIDLETAKIRIRKNGSAGGHRGIDSIIRDTGSRDFIRVKIGVGRDPSTPAEVYVLQKFCKSEVPLMEEAVSKAAQAAIDVINTGVNAAMNKFN